MRDGPFAKWNTNARPCCRAWPAHTRRARWARRAAKMTSTNQTAADAACPFVRVRHTASMSGKTHAHIHARALERTHTKHTRHAHIQTRAVRDRHIGPSYSRHALADSRVMNGLSAKRRNCVYCTKRGGTRRRCRTRVLLALAVAATQLPRGFMTRRSENRKTDTASTTHPGERQARRKKARMCWSGHWA